MTISVRLARNDDEEALVRLFREMDAHYWGAEAPSADENARYVRETVLGGKHACEIAVAELDDEPVAFATFAIVYPAPHLGGQLFMKDVYTAAAARGRGVGLALMRFLAALAVERGCTRFDWTTQDVNERAIAFYERLGAHRVTDKVYLRLDGDDLTAFASGN